MMTWLWLSEHLIDDRSPGWQPNDLSKLRKVVTRESKVVGFKSQQLYYGEELGKPINLALGCGIEMLSSH